VQRAIKAQEGQDRHSRARYAIYVVWWLAEQRIALEELAAWKR
jgi:hypothetical protein